MMVSEKGNRPGTPTVVAMMDSTRMEGIFGIRHLAISTVATMEAMTAVPIRDCIGATLNESQLPIVTPAAISIHEMALSASDSSCIAPSALAVAAVSISLRFEKRPSTGSNLSYSQEAAGSDRNSVK